MAEVSLALDNSGGEIPIDFAEVEITRRAYRDGDNEYLVNGQRVRLQDVIDLLAQTGLGKRTYSVVGQGLIDRALSMAPEERRSLFEEAAGITGYQIKRTTAMRRLDATQTNLTRVQDIVAELSPRLGYLKRQADRARERERIATDLQALLRDWYGYRWHTILRQLEASHAAEAAARTAVPSAPGGAGRSHGTDRRRAQPAARAARRTGRPARIGSRLAPRAETIGRELAVAQERLRQLHARQEDARRELAPLHSQQETLAAASPSCRPPLPRRRCCTLNASRRWMPCRRRSASARRHAGTVQEPGCSTRSPAAPAGPQTDASSRLTQLGERRVVLQAEQAQHTAALEKAQQEVAAAEEALAAAEAQAGQADERVGGLQAEIRAHEAAPEALRGELRQAEETRRAADRPLDRLQTRHDLLSRLRKEGAGYGSGVRNVLAAAQSSKAGGRTGGQLRGILGTVATLLRVPLEPGEGHRDGAGRGTAKRHHRALERCHRRHRISQAAARRARHLSAAGPAVRCCPPSPPRVHAAFSATPWTWWTLTPPSRPPCSSSSIACGWPRTWPPRAARSTISAAAPARPWSRWRAKSCGPAAPSPAAAKTPRRRFALGPRAGAARPAGADRAQQPGGARRRCRLRRLQQAHRDRAPPARTAPAQPRRAGAAGSGAAPAG